MAEYLANLNLSTLNGSNGFKLSGVTGGDNSAFAVSLAGDINGDGFADVIVGAPNADPHGISSGASWVVFGKAQAFTANVNLSSLNGNTGFKLSGVAASDGSGYSVSAAGDVNGDGFGDLVVGAVGADPHGAASGASYIVLGKASGFSATLELSSLDGHNGFRLSGALAGDNCGISVSSAGDVNDDGFDDVIVGARGADPNGTSSGASYVVFGAASFAANVDLSGLNGNNGFKLNGVAASDSSGFDVSSAGDVNSDGFDDVIVGARGADPHGADSGASYVVFGAASFAAAVNLSVLNGNNGFKISGVAAGDESGIAVSSAGDVNGDGIGDVIVGAKSADPHGSGSGASYVVFGKSTGFVANLNLSTLNGHTGFKISGVAADDNLGYSVSSAGDYNGDGFADLLVGAWHADPNGANSGASYVVFGAAGGFAANFDLTALDGNNGFKLSGVAAGDLSGIAASGGGDVNGDGFSDIVVGGYGAAGGAGASYVIFGAKPSEAVTRVGTDIGQTIRGGDFNDTLNGLGGDDTLVGYSGADTMNGGLGNDVLTGAGGNDRLTGGVGKDTLDGGLGVDRFVYTAATNSTGANYDIVKSFRFGSDKWDLSSAVDAIDATIAHGALSTGAMFDTQLAAAADAAHLGAHHAVLFQPNSGNLHDKTFLIVDVNGSAGYQSGHDLVMQLTTPGALAAISTDDFV